MKSAGTTVVPWCRNWWKECWLPVPVPPHTTSPVSHPTGLPSSRTRLPLDSITTCCNQPPNSRSRCEYGTTARDCRPQKLRYHSRQQPHEHRGVGRQRLPREMVVDGPHPGQHLAEAGLPYGDHERQSRRRAERVAAAHPVPHREDVAGPHTELGRRGGVRGRRREMVLHRARPERGCGPGPSRPGVGQRLRSAEALGHHHEQRLGRIQPFIQDRR